MSRYDPRAHGAKCDECPLKAQRPMAPEGDPRKALFVLVGDVPGQHEERSGTPFVGPGGQMLNELLEAANIKRTDCFVTSALLCRPFIPELKGRERYNVQKYLAWLRSKNSKARKELKKLKRSEAEIEASMVKSPFVCCLPRLGNELMAAEETAQARKQPNGAIVIPLGNYAVKSVTGTKSSISKLRGSPMFIATGDES